MAEIFPNSREGLLEKIELSINEGCILKAAMLLEHCTREYLQFIGQDEVNLYHRIRDKFLMKDFESPEGMYKIMENLCNIFGPYRPQLIQELREIFGTEERIKELRERLQQKAI